MAEVAKLVQHVADTLQEKAVFVYENMDWANFFDEIKSSELLYFSIFFLVVKTILPKIESPLLKPFLKLYNGAMAAYSLWTFVMTVKVLQEVKLYSADCTSAFKNEQFDLLAKLFYYSKFVEYIDSFSLKMRGKPVSFLQTFHHFGAPIDMYLFYTAKNEGIWIMVFLNSLVHSVMYTYYLMTMLKIPFPAKPLITLGQITQFNVGFYLVWFYKDVKCYSNSPRLLLGWLYNYFYVGMVLLLFLNFSLQTYILKPSKKSKKTKTE